MKSKLTGITIRGFKSIKELDFSPRPLNVLIGANGAGKSNFLSFFRFLQDLALMELQVSIAKQGGANAILHDGAAKTSGLEARIVIETESGPYEYLFRLSHAAGDTLIFSEERYEHSEKGRTSVAFWEQPHAGHREAAMLRRLSEKDPIAERIHYALLNVEVHQFHNTSQTSRIRQKWELHDNSRLKEDGANLAPYLFKLKKHEPRYYRRIVETIRLILPFFADFHLEPQYDHLLLQWREKGSDLVFSASQASDGMLRMMALVTLLSQPPDQLPALLILDEPELGLHPYGIVVIAGLIGAASHHCQVIVATQSATMVDQFDPEDICVVGRAGRETTFEWLNQDELKEWLQEYSLSELWNKNVLGGRPSK